MNEVINNLENYIYELQLISIELIKIDKKILPFSERKKIIHYLEFFTEVINKQRTILALLKSMQPINLFGGDYFEIAK